MIVTHAFSSRSSYCEPAPQCKKQDCWSLENQWFSNPGANTLKIKYPSVAKPGHLPLNPWNLCQVGRKNCRVMKVTWGCELDRTGASNHPTTLGFEVCLCVSVGLPWTHRFPCWEWSGVGISLYIHIGPVGYLWLLSPLVRPALCIVNHSWLVWKKYN